MFSEKTTSEISIKEMQTKTCSHVEFLNGTKSQIMLRTIEVTLLQGWLQSLQSRRTKIRPEMTADIVTRIKSEI